MRTLKRITAKPLGELLIERGVINRKQLEQALAIQQKQGGLIGQIFIQLGFATEEEIAHAITAQYGLPFLPLENYEVDGEMAQAVPEQVARQYCLVPIDRVGNTLTMAMANPLNLQAVEDVELLTKCVVQIFVSTPSQITRAIDKIYRASGAPRPASPG